MRSAMLIILPALLAQRPGRAAAWEQTSDLVAACRLAVKTLGSTGDNFSNDEMVRTMYRSNFLQGVLATLHNGPRLLCYPKGLLPSAGRSRIREVGRLKSRTLASSAGSSGPAFRRAFPCR